MDFSDDYNTKIESNGPSDLFLNELKNADDVTAMCQFDNKVGTLILTKMRVL